MRGPQCAGLLIGRKDLVGYALLKQQSHEDTLAAVRKSEGRNYWDGEGGGTLSQRDHDALAKEWQGRWTRFRQIVRVPGVNTVFFVPESRITSPICRLLGRGENLFDSDAAAQV